MDYTHESGMISRQAKLAVWMASAVAVCSQQTMLPNSADLSAVFDLQMQRVPYSEIVTGPQVSATASRHDKWGFNVPGIVQSDLNRDGYPDIYITCEGCPNELYLSNGANLDFSAATDSTSGYNLLVDSSESFQSLAVVAFDCNDDGFEDFFVSNLGEPNQLFLSQPSGGFAPWFAAATAEGTYAAGHPLDMSAYAPVIEYSRQSRFSLAGDFNNDGLTDLLVVQWYSYPGYDRGPFNTAKDAGDLNNELYYRIPDGGFERAPDEGALVMMNDGSTLISAINNGQGPWRGVVADWNRDGENFSCLFPQS